MHLIDIGANLAHDSFDEDRDAMMQRAAEAGVGVDEHEGQREARGLRAGGDLIHVRTDSYRIDQAAFAGIDLNNSIFGQDKQLLPVR